MARRNIVAGVNSPCINNKTHKKLNMREKENNTPQYPINHVTYFFTLVC